MDEGFNVYLASNVAPDIFPSNSPSQFSTLLADEVHLNGNAWEVAVRSIMYPSRVKSVTEIEDKMYIYKHKDNYRNILPIPPRIPDAVRLSETEAGRGLITGKVNYTPTKETKDGKEIEYHSVKFKIVLPHPTGNNLIDIKNIERVFNDTEWARKGIYSLEYMAKSRKYILHCYKTDIALKFPLDLVSYLGYDSGIFTRGSHWAWSAFDGKKKLPSPDYAYIIDLRNLIQEKIRLHRTTESDGKFHFKAIIPYKFANNKIAASGRGPKFSMDIVPEEGRITVKPLHDFSREDFPNEQRLIAYSFEKKARGIFRFDPVYNTDKRTDMPMFRTYYKGLIDKMKSFTATLYYGGLRDLEIGHATSPLATIPIDANKAFRKPTDLLPILNAKSAKFGYSFIYDESLQRFIVKCGNDNFIKVTKSLGSILGFDEQKVPNMTFFPATETTAQHFPVLNRAITTVYVYSNIVDSVFVGDVKAPLLLACPYKRDELNDVVQLEFLQPTYTKLNRGQFQQIDIGIYDEAGSPIPFLYGKTVLTLHFRKQMNLM